jgi:hypothetical protein
MDMPSLRLKRALAAGGAALALGTAAFGVAGIAGAQQSPTATPTPGSAQATPRPNPQQREDAFLAALAGKLGVTVDKLKTAIQDTRNELGLPGNGMGFPGGHRGPGGPGGFGRPFGPGGELDAAAQAVGVTVEQLRQEWAGQTLNDVAKAHNVDPAKVSDALKAAANARIDEAVTNNRLTADQATERKQRVATEIDQLMSRQLPQPGQRGGPNPSGTPGPRGNRGSSGQSQSGAQA